MKKNERGIIFSVAKRKKNFQCCQNEEEKERRIFTYWNFHQRGIEFLRIKFCHKINFKLVGTSYRALELARYPHHHHFKKINNSIKNNLNCEKQLSKMSQRKKSYLALMDFRFMSTKVGPHCYISLVNPKVFNQKIS